jgi:hypothetical protein
MGFKIERCEEICMKNTSKKLWFGILALALVFGMTVVGCDDSSSTTDPGGNAGGNKKITVTGLPAKTIDVYIFVLSSIDQFFEGNPVAAGRGNISASKTSVEFTLVTDENDTPWSGSGPHYLLIQIGGDDNDPEIYAYTNGATFEDLEINSPEDAAERLPKFTISSSNSIAFSKFQGFDSGESEGKNNEPENSLVGTWTGAGGNFTFYANGTFSEDSAKGSYTTDGDAITITIEQMRGDGLKNNNGGKILPENTWSTWYTQTTLVPVFASIFPPGTITEAQIATNVALMFAPQEGKYSITGDQLTLTFASSTTYTRVN